MFPYICCFGRNYYISCDLSRSRSDFGTYDESAFRVYALKVLSPGLLIVAVMAVLRGYFQGLGTMVPTAVSQIIEQIINAVVSIVGASVLFGMGSRAGRRREKSC